MTNEDFSDRLKSIRTPLVEKYGSFLYLLANDIFNIKAMEKVCEKNGLVTKRKQKNYSISSEIYFDGKLSGSITNQGAPIIEFQKGRRRFAKLVAKDENIVAPIQGCHSILESHTVTGKLHCLSGGETLLHYLPVDITDDMMIDFLIEMNLTDRVESLKESEKNKAENLKKMLEEQD